ncbi:MAG: hypothetical protein H6578_06265 [Chitinophagales bacterium]|nr:hypothetical protein [Chitinophagales bacterium]
MIRMMIIALVFLSSCANSKKVKQNTEDLKIISSIRTQSTMGMQNPNGSSTSTSYTIKYEENGNAKIEAVYIYGVPYLFKTFVTDEGEKLVVVNIVADKNDESIDKTKSKIKTDRDGVLKYSINGKTTTKSFSFNDNRTIQNK